MSRLRQPRLAEFRSSYAAALREYLHEPSETSLTIAYELGRAAVKQEFTVLELAIAYQEALAGALAVAGPDAEGQAIAGVAGEFFLESLSSFEMLHRGATEARSSVNAYRRQAQLSRQLSTFLTDSSLALRSSDSLEEMLHLAVDHGRELLDAACCLATVATPHSPRAAQAVSHPEPDTDWQFTRWLDLPKIYRLLEQHGGLVTLSAGDAVQLTRSGATNPDLPIRGWLAVSLTALDGGPIGALQAFATNSDFGREDEAALTHLAQMVSGTVERMRLYSPERPQ